MKFLAALLLACLAAAVAQQCSSRAQPGNLNVQWTPGIWDCSQQGALDPAIQVYAYDNSTFVLRQNPCLNYEAPFMYLLLGANQALLLDTGATNSPDLFPLQATVEKVIAQWLAPQQRVRASLQLIVAHSHSHFDHVAADAQFLGQPNTTVVGLGAQAVAAFFRLNPWPQTIGTFDLGGRPLTLVPIPGHATDSIAVFDCQTNLLFTGDTLLPGRLLIADFAGNLASVTRLAAFLQQSVANVNFVLGAHVEMTTTPFVDYPRGTSFVPKAHGLPLQLSHLLELQSALAAMQQNPRVEAHADFIIAPLQVAPPTPGGRVSSHGMIMFSPPAAAAALARSHGNGMVPVQFSHIPMFRQPHDYQIVVSTLVDAATLPSPVPTGLMTLVPDDFSLNDFIAGRVPSFGADLYLGNSEDGGTLIGRIKPSSVIVERAEHLDNTSAVALDTLRYYTFDSVNTTTGSGSGNGPQPVYLLHHMVQSPDFDQVLRVFIDPDQCTSFPGAGGVRAGPPIREWVVYGRTNNESGRLRAGDAVVARLLGDTAFASCIVAVDAELSCLGGPDFGPPCDP